MNRRSKAGKHNWLQIFSRVVYLAAVVFLVSSCSKNNPPDFQQIAVNDAGYRVGDPKVAFVSRSPEPADSFSVVDSQTSQVVFKNVIDTDIKMDFASGDVIHRLSFTELNIPGTYRIDIPGTDFSSVSFQISENLYTEVFKKTAKSFYYQRCGTAVGGGTKWKHAACHLDDAVLFANPDKKMDVTGGWHDAGDYGKYSVNTAVSLSFLLYLYDRKPQAFTDGQLTIPKRKNGNNGIPDLLDEAQWALEWLMKMQRPDGGVYHKVQKKKWTGEYLPQNDPDQRYIFGISSTATADFAAVAALGARLIKPFDGQLSKELAEAARDAWLYLKENPWMVPNGGFKNPEGIKGGEYGDHKDTDERLWASVELYRLTGRDEYHDFFIEHYRELGGPQAPPVSWKNVAELGYYSYLAIPGHQQEAGASKYIAEQLINYADNLVNRVSQNGYRVVLDEDEYYWGSNSVVLGYAFTLVQAYQLTGKTLYRNAALDQLHYILGRNSFGLSFVTGVGDRSVENPYHQLSMRLDTVEPVPGMVVGGPNSHNQLHDEPLSRFPAKNYEDSQDNYMVNETAINYTAPLVYLSGYFTDMKMNSISAKSENDSEN